MATKEEIESFLSRFILKMLLIIYIRLISSPAADFPLYFFLLLKL